jgi:hypothetical protein
MADGTWNVPATGEDAMLIKVRVSEYLRLVDQLQAVLVGRFAEVDYEDLLVVEAYCNAADQLEHVNQRGWLMVRDDQWQRMQALGASYQAELPDAANEVEPEVNEDDRTDGEPEVPGDVPGCDGA